MANIAVLQCGDLKRCDGTVFNPALHSVVDCASLAGLVQAEASNVVCSLLAAVTASGGTATATTKLIGSDCKTYTIPPTPVDLNVTAFEVVGSDLILKDADGSDFAIPLNSLVRLTGTNGATVNLATAQVPIATDFVKCTGAPFVFGTDKIASCGDVPAVIAPAVPAAGQPSAPATITPPGSTTPIKIPQALTDCAGGVVDLTDPTTKIPTCGTLAAALTGVLKKCDGATAFNPATDLVVDCATHQLALDRITALETAISNINTLLNSAHTLTDCAGVAFAKALPL